MLEFFGKKISGPFTIPSGVVATSVEVLEKLAREIPELGILTTKSIGWEPKEGYRSPILAKHDDRSFVNAVGLTNPGAREFARQLSTRTWPADKFLLISLYGQGPADFLKSARALLEWADGFELNLSCPHADRYGQAIGADYALVEKIVGAVKSLGKPVLVKVSPNLDISKTVEASSRGGADGFVGVNTQGPVVPAFHGFPVLGNERGGISGSALKKSGVDCIKQIRSLSNKTIIACGGIRNANDVREYQSVGADFFGVGSALAHLSTEEVKNYFEGLTKDLGGSGNEADKLLFGGINMDYRALAVKRKYFYAEDLFQLEMEQKIKTAPGQFIFVWLPEKGEAPFSVIDDDPLTLLIKRKGCFTQALSELEPGDNCYIRGPYGQVPVTKGCTLLVGGGTGLAALYLFAKYQPETVTILGAKSKQYLPFTEEFREKSKQLFLMTEDGSLGERGLVSEKLSDLMQEIKPEYCLNCGPSKMIEGVIAQQRLFLPDERILSSVEFMTRCGAGLCGRCATPKGYRNCVDGTFLPADQLF